MVRKKTLMTTVKDYTDHVDFLFPGLAIATYAVALGGILFGSSSKCAKTQQTDGFGEFSITVLRRF